MLLLLFRFTSLADTYYVDKNHPSASDSNPGTINLPWLTIQHSFETITAGDTVFIRQGIYNEQVSTINDGNLSDGYIVISAYPNENPVIDGTGLTESTGLLISNSYIEFIGLEIRNWDTCIWMEYASFIELAECEVHQCTFGIGVSYGTHDFVLNKVLMHHFDLYGFDATPDGGLVCYNGILNDCISHTGRDPQQNVDGFALGHGAQQNFIFNRCTTYNVFDGFDISSRNTTLNSCLSYNNNGGYKLWQDDVKLINCIAYGNSSANVELDWDNESGKTTLFNCTFFDAGTFNIWVENTNDTLYMYNCIIAGGDNIGLAFELMGVSNYFGDYNIFHNDNADRAIIVGYTDEFSLEQIQNGEWTQYSGQDVHSLVTFNLNNFFVDINSNNLHLTSSSLAVDKGASHNAPDTDFDGNTRPSGQGYDIGAYEYQFPSNLNESGVQTIPELFLLHQNYPNPFNPGTTISWQSPVGSHQTIKVFDVLGNEIATLVDEYKPAGRYEVEFDASHLASGIYFYKLQAVPIGRQAGEYTAVKKMILIK